MLLIEPSVNDKKSVWIAHLRTGHARQRQLAWACWYLVRHLHEVGAQT